MNDRKMIGAMLVGVSIWIALRVFSEPTFAIGLTRYVERCLWLSEFYIGHFLTAVVIVVAVALMFVYGLWLLISPNR